MSGRSSSPNKGSLGSRGSSPSGEVSDSGRGGRSAGSSGSSKKEKSADTGKKKTDIDGIAAKDKSTGSKRNTFLDRTSVGGTIFAAMPKLKETPADEQGVLFCQKLAACCIVYDFRASERQLPEKEGKRQTLVELLELVNERKPSIWLDETVLAETVDMMSANLFRTLTKRERLLHDLADADEEDPAFDPCWPHLEPVYEMLQKLVACKDMEPNYVGRFVNPQFITKVIELTDSDDPRERENLKGIMRRIQDKMTSARSSLRKAINSQLQLALIEGTVVNGLPEMLEVYSRFVSSFSTPLKDDHRDLFRRVMLPLHKVEWVAVYHKQLLDVMKKFCEKDPKLAVEVGQALLRFWPRMVSAKQVLFLPELDDMLGLMPSGELKKLQPQLGKVMVDCLICVNSDVADKALVMWKSERFMKMIFSQCKELVPGIISALYNNATQHWQHSVHVRTLEVLKLLLDRDPELFDSSSASHRKACEEKEKKDLLREKRWALLQAMHDKKLAAPPPDMRDESRSASPRRRSSTAITTAATRVPDSEAVARTLSPSGRRASRVAGSPRPPPTKGLTLSKGRYGFAMSWAASEPPAQLALQAALVDSRGRIVDTICELNPVASNGAVVLRRTDILKLEAMRKERTGTLWVQLSQLPASIVAVLLVASVQGGRLQDIELCELHVVEMVRSQVAAHFSVERPSGGSVVVSAIRRDPQGHWAIVCCSECSKAGRHIVDIVEPTMGKVIRDSISTLPKRHKAMLTLFSISRGGVIYLPLSSAAKFLFVGMSWDMPALVDHQHHQDNLNHKEIAGLGVALVYLDSQGQALGAAEAAGGGPALGARHGGKSLTGQGCFLDLNAAPDSTSQIFVVGFMLPDSNTTEPIHKIHCSVVYPSCGTELVRYKLPEESTHQEMPPGWLAGRFICTEEHAVGNDTGARWLFQALGLPSAGASWQSSLADIQRRFKEPPSSYQVLPPEIPDISPTRVVSL